METPRSKLDVSVIVRVGNRPAFFVRRALASVQEQIIPVAEIVLVPVGDEGRAIVDALMLAPGVVGPTITHAATVPAGSPGAALNKGAEIARGHWLAFLDDDDTWKPQFTLEMSKLLDPSEGASLVSQAEVVFERWDEASGSCEETGRLLFNPELRRVGLSALRTDNRFTNNALIMPKHSWMALDGWREDLKSLEDWEFNVRLSERYRIDVIPRPLVCYHRRVSHGGVVPNSSMALHGLDERGLRLKWWRDDQKNGRSAGGRLALLACLIGAGWAASQLRHRSRRIMGRLRGKYLQ